MKLPNWAYCLPEDEYIKIKKIIDKMPMLSQYVASNDNSDLIQILLNYQYIKNADGSCTVGERLNINLLIKKYDLLKKEYNLNSIDLNNQLEFRIDSILTWRPKPKWAQKMNTEEIDYLDHFIPLVPGLSQFIYRNQDWENLFDLTAYYQLRLNATGKNNPEIDFILETIKERFYRIMDDHQDAIHYVNHSHTIDDKKIIEAFEREARTNLYLTDPNKNLNEVFLKRYSEVRNPYIQSEIFTKFLRADKINIALNAAHSVFKVIFSSPNIYWHNKESIFGSINILYPLMESLGETGLKQIEVENRNFKEAFVGTIYLMLSRAIYWSDKESVKREKYDMKLLPINIQHKLRAYRLRSQVILSFGTLLFPELTSKDYKMMALSDMISAHNIAYNYRIVGEDSVFKRDAKNLYYSSGLVTNMSLDQAFEKGFEINDKKSQDIHLKYKNCVLRLSDSDISKGISFMRIYFIKRKIESIESNPNFFVYKDNIYPEHKREADKIKQYLMNNGVEFFYHFTEKDKIESIIKHGGLLSYKRCLDEGIVLPLREDMAFSRDSDAQLGLEDYARISFSHNLPKIEIRKNEGAELVMLKISTEVALFSETLFTNIEATHPMMRYGKSFEDLQAVNMKIAIDTEYPTNEKEFLEQQAEVLIKGIIPLKYILNIDNPEII